MVPWRKRETEVPLLPPPGTPRQRRQTAWQARGNEYFNRHPVQRIAFGFVMFGGFAAFLTARFIINNASGDLPWWSDTVALIGAAAAIPVLLYAFKSKVLVRGPDGSDLERMAARVVLVAFVTLPVIVAMPRRHGPGFAFSPRIQVIGDAMGVVLCALIVITVTRTTLRKWRERGSNEDVSKPNPAQVTTQVMQQADPC